MAVHSFDKIKLRSFEKSDADVLYQWENDSTAWDNNGIYNPISKYHIEDFIINNSAYLRNNTDMTLAIELTENSILIGYIQILEYDAINRRAFVGIFIQKDYRNTGYGTTALNGIIEYAFRRWNIRMLLSKVLSNNEASKRLFEKCGFENIASIPQWAWVNGDFVALNYYILCNQ